MGIPANEETMRWRKKAHAVLDPFITKWFPGKRKKGYEFMGNAMNLSERETHIGRFTIVKCKEMIEIIDNTNKAWLKQQNNK